MEAAVKRRKAGSAEQVDKENAHSNAGRGKGEIPGLQKQKTVEEIYQKKTQLEHILLRPDSYVGSIERQTQEHWVFDDASGKMTKQTLQYIPALYKILTRFF
eukprot:TRINITY_DN5394_c0_g1_i1.p2 TRINITY_DN5394_c0_g1~~TRINITY_DN5394_c0_g1_i1.p2  ORF type:complete len:102 (-),score=25.44 TRINITY_DN5394_c0_g1_i1:284-589(-)